MGHLIRRWLCVWTAWKHQSRLSWREAPQYTRYWKQCQRHYKGIIPSLPSLRDFQQDGIAVLWHPRTHDLARTLKYRLEQDTRWNAAGVYTGELQGSEIQSLFQDYLADWLEAVYRCPFKVYYATCFKSWHQQDEPTGSQLWHADGGPGTCINILWYLSPATTENGAFQCLPWPYTRWIFAQEFKRHELRNAPRTQLCEFYRQWIEKRYLFQTVKPLGSPGLLVAFKNNLLHRGGHPNAGHTRLACIFHCYPSLYSTPFERYRTGSLSKRASYPRDPAKEF